MTGGTFILLHSLFTCLILLLPSGSSFSLEPLIIDVRQDIPDNGQWDFDCPLGYASVPDEYISCDFGGGGIVFPPEDLNGEEGFWTKCREQCVISYTSKPGVDTTFSARLYQRGIASQIDVDGYTSFVSGTGWVDYSRYLGNDNETHTIVLHLEFYGGDIYSLLDKIVLNGEIPSTTTTVTTPSSSTLITNEPSSSITTSDATTTSEPATTTSEPATTTSDPAATTAAPSQPFSSTSLSPGLLIIDVRQNIPENGQWDFDCALGYATTPDEFVSCEFSGGVSFPPGDLNGEKGFWTNCREQCVISYTSKPGVDTTFSARLYQRGVATQIEVDGYTNFVNGTGWVEHLIVLEEEEIEAHTISLYLEYYGNDIYSLLDKIVLNGDMSKIT